MVYVRGSRWRWGVHSKRREFAFNLEKLISSCSGMAGALPDKTPPNWSTVDCTRTYCALFLYHLVLEFHIIEPISVKSRSKSDYSPKSNISPQSSPESSNYCALCRKRFANEQTFK